MGMCINYTAQGGAATEAETPKFIDVNCENVTAVSNLTLSFSPLFMYSIDTESTGPIHSDNSRVRLSASATKSQLHVV